MSIAADEILKRLKGICLKLAKEKDTSEHVADLKRHIAKGRYFEQQSFKELIEVVSDSSLPISKASEIFKLMRTIIDEKTGNKDFLIICLHNFLADKKYRLDLLGELTTLCTFDEAPECKSPENIAYIAEQLLEVTTEKQRLYQNYDTICRQYGRDEKLITLLMGSITRVVAKFIKDKKWNEIVEFLTATVLNATSSQTLVISNDEVFKIVLKIISLLIQCGHAQSNVMAFCFLLVGKLANVLTNKDFQKCCDILKIVLRMCCDGAITEVGLEELQSAHYKTAKKAGESFWLQEVTRLITQLFKEKVNLFEATAACFGTYHHLLVKFFHVFKFIKNEEGSVPCCSDIKRHKILSAIETIMIFACNIVKAEKFDSSLAKYVEYHVKYKLEICNGLKCKSKDNELLKASVRTHNFIYQFTLLPSLQETHIKHLDYCLTIMFKLYNQIPQEAKATTVNLSQMLNIYGKPKDKHSALVHANGIASQLAYCRKFATEGTKETKVHKQFLMRLTIALRNAVKLLGYESAKDFIRSDLFEDRKFSGDPFDIPQAEFILIEITALFRYGSVGQTEEKIEKLFMELIEGTTDIKLLAEASQALTDSTLKVMKTKEHLDGLKKVIKLLEQERKKRFEFEVSLALALNNYSIFYLKYNLVPRSREKQNMNEMIGKLQLLEELEYLGYLNESLCHFTDLTCHLMQYKEDSEKILSMTRVLSILRIMSTQYFMRGIKYKDFEAFTLLWHLVAVQGESKKDILNIATFFIDHHQSLTDSTGNYLKFSKKIKPLTLGHIMERANETLDKEFIPTFEEQTTATQSYILSYLLSLWVYLVTKKKQSGFTRWDQFKSLWKTWKVPQEDSNRVTIHAKMYFCLMEINLKCFNRSADSFLSLGCTKLLSTTSFDHEFACQHHQIYYRYIMEAINYSMNRCVDMDHYEQGIQSLIVTVANNRFCLKTLELLSFSILRYLDMEKLERAKVQLQQITKLLGINQEILVDSPVKAETVLDLDFQLEEISRKNVVAPSRTIQCEISTVYEDNTELLSHQLESFVHKLSCHCEICKAPQLKFISFQVGCHYSRLMWLTGKWNVSFRFNEFALDPWRDICDKLRRIKDSEFLMINKISFGIFSIRWLFQCADTLIRLDRFDEVEEIYEEVNLSCAANIPDYECFKQALFCRKENLNHLIEQSKVQEKEIAPSLSFVEFLKRKPPAKKFTRRIAAPRIVHPVVFVDLSDEESLPPPKVAAKTAKKPKASPSDANPKDPTKAKSAPRRAKAIDIEAKDGSSSSSSASSATASLRSSRRRMI